jgi:hypothetical protein
MKEAFDHNLPRMKPHLRLPHEPTENAARPIESGPDDPGTADPSLDVQPGAAEALLSTAEGLAGELAEARARGDRLEAELVRTRADLERARGEVARLIRQSGRAGGRSPEALVETARQHPDDRVRAAAVVACLRFGTRSERLALLFGDSAPGVGRSRQWPKIGRLG